MKLFILFTILSLISSVFGYDCKACGIMCCNIPSNHVYYLTDFCGGSGTTACGYACDAMRYFTADKQRFGCNSYLQICAVGKCLKAKVIDAGPAAWVEKDADMPIIDSSVPTCQYFTGSSSCGWSDRFKITAVATSVGDDSELGPFNVTAEMYKSIVSAEQLEFDQQYFAMKREMEKKQQEADARAKLAQCCTPSQWQAYQFSFDERHHFRAGLNVSYDAVNQRVAVIAHDTFGERRRTLASIALHKQQKLYIIDYSSQTCRVEPLNRPFEQDCIPQEAVKRSSITLGGSLKANVWDFDVFNGSAKVLDTRSESCIPVYSAFIDHRYGVDLNFVWDVTNGISNTSVFDVPSICSKANPNAELSHPRSASFLEIVDSVLQGKAFYNKW